MRERTCNYVCCNIENMFESVYMLQHMLRHVLHVICICVGGGQTDYSILLMRLRQNFEMNRRRNKKMTAIKVNGINGDSPGVKIHMPYFFACKNKTLISTGTL